MHLQEQQRRCSIFLQAAQRGHIGRREFRMALWAKRSKDAAVLLTKAAVAKLEILAACRVRHVIWSMKFRRAVLKLQSCCRGWRARNSNEYSRRRRIKSKIICRLQNDSAITKLQRKIRAFKVQKAVALGLDLPDEPPPAPPSPPDLDTLPYAAPEVASVSPVRRMWPRLPSNPPLSSDERAQTLQRILSLERAKQENLIFVSRPADATFAAAVLLQLQRSLFPRHAMALSLLPQDKNERHLAAAAAAFDDLKMNTPYGEFPEINQQLSLRFLREKDSDIEARAAAEEQRQFGESFPNLAPSDEEEKNSAGRTLEKHEHAVNRRVDDPLGPKHAHVLRERHVLLPQVPGYLRLLPSTSAAHLPEATALNVSATWVHPPSLSVFPGKNMRKYVAAVPNDSDAPEARDLPMPWFWLHPIASTDTRVLDVLMPIMHEEDSAALKRMVQLRQWLPAARIMRATLSQLLLGSFDGSMAHADDDKTGIDASLALLVFMITAAHSMIPLATGAEGETQALLLKLPTPPPPSAISAAKLMSDAATVLGMARALLNAHPLDSCKLHAKLQCWLGSVEACKLYHEQRNTAAAEALVQALVWESKYRAGGSKAGITVVRRSTNGDDHVTLEAQSSSLYLRCCVTLQLSSVCLRCGDVSQSENLALQVLDSVSLFEAKKRDEHWSVMGACAELLLARMCALADERVMEAQQWVRKASRSADRVAGPGRKSATRKPDALQVALTFSCCLIFVLLHYTSQTLLAAFRIFDSMTACTCRLEPTRCLSRQRHAQRRNDQARTSWMLHLKLVFYHHSDWRVVSFFNNDFTVTFAVRVSRWTELRGYVHCPTIILLRGFFCNFEAEWRIHCTFQAGSSESTRPSGAAFHGNFCGLPRSSSL